jgi:hypothetical protein
MNVANVYGKSLNFFSRSRQEKIVSSIEHSFYQAITVYTKDPHSDSQLNLKLEKICSEVRYYTAHSYFEDDLLEYMFNLLSFVTNYMADLQAGPSGSHVNMGKIQAERQMLFCSEPGIKIPSNSIR